MTASEIPGSSPSAERLSRDGFVMLHRLCDPDFVARILDVSRRRSQEIRTALGKREIGIGSAAGYIEIVQRSPGRWDVPITPTQFGVADRDMPWWPVVEAVLGEDAEHSFSGVVYSEPGSPAQHWHTDSPHLESGHLPPHALNVLVALHDVPLEMGPTEFAHGSHVLTNHLENPVLVCDELIYQHEGTTPQRLVEGTQRAAPDCSAAAALAEGSCVLFDDRILHRGLANHSDAIRHVAYFSYRRKAYTENTHFESQRSVFD